MSVKILHLHMCDRCGNVANTVEHMWIPGTSAPNPSRQYLGNGLLNLDLCSICAPEITSRLDALLKKPVAP